MVYHVGDGVQKQNALDLNYISIEKISGKCLRNDMRYTFIYKCIFINLFINVNEIYIYKHYSPFTCQERQ